MQRLSCHSISLGRKFKLGSFTVVRALPIRPVAVNLSAILVEFDGARFGS